MASQPFFPILCVVLSTIPVCAQTRWSLPLLTSDPAQAYDAARKFVAPADASVYLIDLNITVHIDDAGRASVTRRGILRILDESGVPAVAHLSEPWLAWRQRRPVVQARVITPDKQAHTLDQSTLTEAGLPGANETFGDTKVLQATFPAIGPNTVVEYQVEDADREAVMPGERFDHLAFPQPVPIHHFVVVVEGGPRLRAVARGFEKIDRQQSATGENRTVRFEAWDVKPHKAETMLPPELPEAPEIFYSTADSWQDVAKWYASGTETILAPTEAAAQPPPAPSERNTRIAAILADIQKKVRYTGLELGSAAYIPRKPDETLARGYGDCKDKAALLANRLRAAGIPAKLALLTPYPHADTLPEIPGLEAFRHAIVYVPGTPPLWIDATAQYAPATRLPSADQGRAALIIDPASTGLVQTPQSTAAENHGTEEVTVTMRPEGKADLSGIETYVGAKEDVVRPMFARLASPELQAKVKDQLKARSSLDKIANIDITKAEDLAGPFRISYSGEGWTFAATRGDTAEALVATGIQVSLVQGFQASVESDRSDSRKADYDTGMAMSGEHRQIVIPPIGFKLKQLPEVPKVDLSPLTYHRTISVRPDNAVVVTETFESPRRYTPEEAKRVAAGLKKLLAAPPIHLYFIDETQQLISAGKDREALALARQRVRAEPHSVAALEGLAGTLSAAGANSLAIETCLQATRLDPKSAIAFRELGAFYGRDELGRPYRRGMRYAEAVQALQHAIELDPTNASIKLNLSSLYQFDSFGARFSPRARMADSVTLLQEIEPELKKLNSTEALPLALLFNRQYSEVKNLYEKDRHVGNSRYRYAAIAASEGVDAAKEAYDGAESSEDRKSVFAQAGNSLLLLHEYKASAGLLREAYKDDSGAPQGEFDLLAQTRPREHAQFSKDPPVALVQHLIYALLDVADEDSWRQLYAPESRQLTLAGERSQLRGLLRGWATVARQTLSWAELTDVAVSNGAFSSDGSGEVGYRVRIADPASNGAPRTLAWVVKRGADYLVLGTGGDWAAPAGQAFEAAQEGDLKAAAQWLDWLREELHEPATLDPLDVMPFIKLWPLPNAGAQDTALAAASMAARGLHYEDPLRALLDFLPKAPGTQHDYLEIAILDCYTLHGQFEKAIPYAQHLYEKFPSSDRAFQSLYVSMIQAGKLSEATKLVQERLSKDPNSAPGLRAQARVALAAKNYKDAVASLRKLSATPKVTAGDWNDLAWYALYTDEVGDRDLEAANTAMRLTQSRNPAYVHTLGCLKAIRGDSAEARKLLAQYVDSQYDFNDSARLLLGLILESLDLPESARGMYEKLTPPKTGSQTSLYDLAQRRLAAMHGPAAYQR